METKIIKIKDICPEGYKLDKEKSTLDNLFFIGKINYNYISEKLFKEKNFYYITYDGDIRKVREASSSSLSCHMTDKNNCTSKKQAEKLLAINMLLNVAKYLNGDWKPNWNDDNEKKYTISLDRNNKKINITWNVLVNKCPVYFKTEELAQKAIDILGEETIKLALSTDW